MQTAGHADSKFLAEGDMSGAEWQNLGSGEYDPIFQRRKNSKINVKNNKKSLKIQIPANEQMLF